MIQLTAEQKAAFKIDNEGKKSLEFKPLQIEPDLMSD